MTPELRTARLWLRPLELADATQAQALFPHPEIVRYMAAVVPWPYPADGVLSFYRDFALPAVERGEAWHWSLRLQEDPVLRVGKATANEASRRISIREGMRLVRTEERAFVSGRLEAEVWEISAAEWRARIPLPGTF